MTAEIPRWEGFDASRDALLARRQPDDSALSDAERRILARLYDDQPGFDAAVDRIIAEVREGGDARKIPQR